MSRNDTDPGLRLVGHDEGTVPEDLTGVAAALDALAEQERGEAPEDLSARIFAASSGSLGPVVAGRVSDAARGAAAPSRSWTPLRAAAAVALASTVAVSLMAGRAGPSRIARSEASPANLEHYIDWWASSGDAAGTDLSATVRTLESESAALGATLSGNSTGYELWADEGAL